MNCDEAFDALTDPTARPNSALQWHLELCPRCREMQKVLAPALALLTSEGELPATRGEEGSLAASTNRLPAEFREDSRTQRANAPFLTPEAVRLAEQTARRLHPDSQRFANRCTRWVAVCLLGVLALAGVYFAMTPAKPVSPRASQPLMLADQCLWTEKNNPSATTPETPTSRWVVLSCVSCHLEHTIE